MNQILINKDENNIINNQVDLKKYSSKNNNFIYKIIFYSSIFLLIISIIILFIRVYQGNLNEQISKKLTDSYTISTLYAANNNYNPIVIEETTPFVIRHNKDWQNKLELLYFVC